MIQLAIPAPAPAGAGPTAELPPTVIGLDIALNRTGIAGHGWTTNVYAGQRTGHERLNFQIRTMQSYYRNATFVVIEGAAFSKALLPGADDLSGLRWMVRHDLWKRGIPYAVVPPDNRTIFATGKARWKDPESGKKLTNVQVKGLVRTAVAEQYGIECTGPGRYDEADAYVLLAMARTHLGHPLAELPDTHTRALAGVAWPERGDQ